MSSQAVDVFDQCTECEKAFRRVRTSDPRKGYDVLREDAAGWEVQCKGCGETHLIHK